MDLRRAVRVSLIALWALCAASVTAWAQVPTGTIVGTVLDMQGLAVGEAAVTLTNQATASSQTAATSSHGGFQFTHINAGVYRVEVSKPGFRQVVMTGIKLDASTQYSIPPVVLQVGAITEKVIVAAGANLVGTAGAELTATIERRQIEDLPILDRDPLLLLPLQAGVSQNHQTPLAPTVINGQRASFSSMTLDGINIQDNYLRPNALDYTPNLLLITQTGEFTTTTQNAAPQAGLGSSQVSIVTPSGTNQWHGESFWYYRTDAWKANEWFNDANGIPKPSLVQNQAGGDIGGPVVKNKLFVYGAYELFRNRDQSLTTTTVLSGPARAGNFQWRATCTTSCPAGIARGSIQSANILSLEHQERPSNFGPNQNQPWPVLPIDPVIAGLLARVPAAINNLSIGDGLNAGGYSFNQRGNRTRDNTSLRLDWNPLAKHSFTGTYAWNRDYLERPGNTLLLPDTYDAVPSAFNREHENFLSAAWRWSPNSNFTNEVRFGFDLAPIHFLTTQRLGSFTVSGTLFNNPDQNAFPSSRVTHTWSWQDNASWVRGNHTVGFGMQVQRVTVFATNAFNTLPNLAIGDFYSPQALASSDFTGQGGIASADLEAANSLLSSLAGMIYQETQTFNATSRTSGYVQGAAATNNFRWNNWALYAGDSWKFHKNLSLNYGLRWEYYSPFDERDGLLMLPVVPAGQTVQQTLASDATLSFAGGNSGRRPYNKNWNNFAPNVGVAWDPFGDGRTSIRAGYSINYVNDELIYAPYNAALSNPGVTAQTGLSFLSTTISSPARPTISIPPISNTFSGNWMNLYKFDTGLNFGFAIDPNLRTPYVHQWNLAVQRDIGRSTSLKVSYVGNRGSRLYRAVDLNQLILTSTGFLKAFNALRSNGFLALAATGTFDPNYNASIPGSQQITYFSKPNFAFGDLAPFGFGPLIDEYLQQGAAGELANLYHSTSSDAPDFGAKVQLAQNPHLEAADLLENYSTSIYHAGDVEIRRRTAAGLTFQVNYTFSKVMTDYSGLTSTRFAALLDNANPGLEWARADFDLTHALKGNFSYEVPLGKGHSWSPSSVWLNQLVSGWKVSSIMGWQSGAPFSILSGLGTLNRSGRSQTTNTATTSLTVKQIASQLGKYHGPNGEVLLINPKFIGPDGRGAPNFALTCTPLVSGGFCNPGPGAVGNLPRNAFNSPPFFNWDLSILKRFPFGEAKELVYRVDMFNAFNHPTFAVANASTGAPDMNINDTNFGVATSAASTSRVIQMGLRFDF